MTLTIGDIKKLADLAKIEITTDEEQSYLKDINNILEHLAMVKDADTTGVETSFNFFNQTREDDLANGENKRDFSSEIIFADIPNKSKDNYVKVSKVIKK